MTIEAETKDTCRQTLEGDVDIKIFGLGHIAETIIADNLKKVYSGIPQIVERYTAQLTVAVLLLQLLASQSCT